MRPGGILRENCRCRRGGPAARGQRAPARAASAALAAAATAAIALAAAGPAPAAPLISIKAHATVELDRAHRDPDGRITVSGRVVDRGGGGGVPYALVDVHLDGAETPIMSDERGHFRAFFAAGGGLHDLEVDYDGDAHHTPAQAVLRRFDVAKEPLSLSLSVPDRVPTSVRQIEVAVTARVDSEPASITAALYAGPDDDGDAPLARVGDITTDTTGRGTAEIRRAALGKPGEKRVEARFAGDASRSQASASAELSLIADTTLTFRLERARVRPSGVVRGRGTLTRAGGAPISGAAVALAAGEQRVGATLTGPDGSFTLSVPAAEIRRRRVLVQAIFQPSRPWLRGSRSRPLDLVIAPSDPAPVGTTLIAFALTALFLVAFVLLRTRPWLAWARRSRRGPRRASAAPGALVPQAGLSPARPGLVSTLRRAHDHGVAGRICDAATSAPIAGARVALDGGDLGARETRSGPDGRFAIAALTAGRWQVEVSARGYVSERFAIAVPHRGELRGARIRLLPVRERIFALYQEAALPLLPSERLWGVWTPRQILDHVRRGRPAAALSALTDYVEEAYFSQRVPEESSLGEASARAEAARREIRDRGAG